MSSPAKILVIGLDSCEPEIASRMLDEGKLPNLANLMQAGAYQQTSNPPGFFVGAVWPSFYTGVSPTRHGRYCFRQLVPGSYEVEPFLPAHVKQPPFWRVLSEAGRRVAVLDVPHTYEEKDLNGIQLLDWGAHDSDLGFGSWPSSLGEEVQSRYGEHPVPGHCNAARLTQEDFRLFRGQLLDGIDLRTQLSLDLLERGDWDLFLTVFSEPHCAGHQCWHLHDPSHPYHDPEVAGAIGDPVEEVYAKLDGAVGELVSRVGQDATVMVLLSHGMGPRYEGTAMLDEILARIETASLNTGRRRLVRGLRWGWGHTPAPLRRLVSDRFAASGPSGNGKSLVADVGRKPNSRPSFAVPNNDTYGAIRVNLAGREPEGRLRANELDQYLSKLSRDLLDLVNPATGRPAVNRVLRTAELYNGDVSSMPDLLVEWAWDDTIIEGVSSPKIGTVSRPSRSAFTGVHQFRTGDHRPDGMVVVRGPSVTPGRLERAVKATELAPTICSLLGVELPDADGTVLAGLTGVASESGASI